MQSATAEAPAAAKQFGQLLSVNEVAEVLGISRATVYRYQDSEPGFPQPRRIGTAKRYLLTEVLDYIGELPHAEGV